MPTYGPWVDVTDAEQVSHFPSGETAGGLISGPYWKRTTSTDSPGRAASETESPPDHELQTSLWPRVGHDLSDYPGAGSWTFWRGHLHVSAAIDPANYVPPPPPGAHWEFDSYTLLSSVITLTSHGGDGPLMNFGYYFAVYGGPGSIICGQFTGGVTIPVTVDPASDGCGFVNGWDLDPPDGLEPPGSPMQGAVFDVWDDLAEHTATVAAGAQQTIVEPTITYHFSFRYRAVSDYPPPQRQFPRDDGLAISTNRSWPSPTSQQYSQRRGPASYL